MIIGIDVGGTNIKFGLLDMDNNLVFDSSMVTGANQDEVIDNLSSIIVGLKRQAKKAFNSNIHGVGIGIPGVINKGLDHVFRCPNLGWDNVALRDILKERTGFSVFIDNDANLAALAEYHIGSLKGIDTGILLTLGTGVGGGVIIHGRPYRGGNGLGLEVGHMVIGENFFDCNCGKNGCLETFASATAIVKYFEKLIKDENASIGYEISAKQIFQRAELGEALPLKAVERYTTYLAIGMVNIINVIDPEVISLGGGVAAAGSFLMDMVKAKVDSHLMVEGFPSARITYATAGNRAGIIGAALLAKEELALG